MYVAIVEYKENGDIPFPRCISSSLANRRREPMNGGNWQQHGSAVSGSLCERCLHMSLLLRGDDSDAAANCSPPVMSCVSGVSEPYREM